MGKGQTVVAMVLAKVEVGKVKEEEKGERRGERRGGRSVCGVWLESRRCRFERKSHG